MKRTTVCLWAALAVILSSTAAFALATEGCADWVGSWTFNYGGSDNQTVYLDTVCDSRLGCPSKSVMTCYVTGIRASDEQPILLATSDFEPGAWAYYHTYTPTNALEPYERIAGYDPGAHYFNDVTAPTVGGPSGVPPALGSGLTYGRRFSPVSLRPGACADWLGSWDFTYYNIATADIPADTKIDTVTITQVCNNDPACTDTAVWECVATGQRPSDQMPITIGRKTGNTGYYYSEVANETLMQPAAYSLIKDADFLWDSFAASQTTGFDYQTAPNHLISGKKSATSSSTTTSIAAAACDDWLGTWDLTYDSSKDTDPADAKGNGRNGTYEVKICSIQKDITVDGITFSCLAQGTRTVDGQPVFIARSQYSTTKYRFYDDIQNFNMTDAVNGAILLDENFTVNRFTASDSSYGLVSGVKTGNSCELPGPTFLVPDTGDPNERVCNPHSYTDLGNGIIQDGVTGLMWQKSTAPGTYAWQQAIDYCDTLTLGGNADWRLPPIKELATLVDSSIAPPGPNINTAYFPATQQNFYWSATPLANIAGGAWEVKFDYGVIVHGYDNTESNYVRAVRGQGLTNKFIDNGDGTVTDISTGLMWQQSTPSATYTWEQAKAYCEGLTLGANSDWRLPTRNEMQSIVDYTTANPAINASYFPGTAGAMHWTSTSNAYNASNAWGVNFYNGNAFYDYPKTGVYYVRAVRAGQCGPAGTSTTTTIPGGTTTTTTVPGNSCPAKKVLGPQNPMLENLRDFRDAVLAQSYPGRMLIQSYYRNAGSIDAALERSPVLRAAARRVLEVIVPLVRNRE